MGNLAVLRVIEDSRTVHFFGWIIDGFIDQDRERHASRRSETDPAHDSITVDHVETSDHEKQALTDCVMADVVSRDVIDQRLCFEVIL